MVPEGGNTVGRSQARERHLEGSMISTVPGIPTSTPRHTGQVIEGPSNGKRVEDGKESIEDLEQKAFSKLDDFHTLGDTLAYISQPPFVYCRSHRAQQPYQDLSIGEKLHDLLINIHGIAVEANAMNEARAARLILYRLVHALDQYPICQMLDKRKRHILLKMALMFQELGHHWDYERILVKIADMYQSSAMPPLGEPYHLLAHSFPASSASIHRTLVSLWNETVGGNQVDSNLKVPPLHAAVQLRKPMIIFALLSNCNESCSSPLASSLTPFSTTGQFIEIEQRDISNCTALFKAVANGDHDCSLALLMMGADANTRDEHGHTALEVAVTRGDPQIVNSLIGYGACVNPDITGCSSLPLHAAIESGNFHLEIIRQLLDAGAEVDLRRFVDNKHAIDLALDWGYHDLAEEMRQKLPCPSRTSFMIRDPLIGQIIS